MPFRMMRAEESYKDDDIAMSDEEDMSDDVWVCGESSTRGSRVESRGLDRFCENMGLTMPSIMSPSGRKREEAGEQKASGMRGDCQSKERGSVRSEWKRVGDSPLAVEFLGGRVSA